MRVNVCERMPTFVAPCIRMLIHVNASILQRRAKAGGDVTVALQVVTLMLS